ncbi:MAG: hypothetical protein KKD01_20235, partial [Proteobacteria bacterium]|nr:hypothetical protein [Pseudomonadota bacterium]
MRCPDCNKFVGMDVDNEPEGNGFDIDDEGVLTDSVRIVNVCADCGTELKEANVDLEIDLSAEVAAHRAACHVEGDDHELEVTDETLERTERSEGKGRGTRTFYGV